MKTLVAIIISLLIPLAFAKNSVPLPAEKAFSLSIFSTQKNQFVLEWQIAPHYYLYRDHLTIAASPSSVVKIKPVILPPGQLKKGPLQHNDSVYFSQLQVPLVILNKGAAGTLEVAVGYQGCSEDGFCYAPIKKFLKVDLQGLKSGQNLNHYIQGPTATVTAPLSSQTYAEAIFDGHSLFIVVLSFLGIGLLLSFTPCILPMVPILSGIIMGHRHRLTTTKTFLLSLAYVLGMAVTYALAGMVVALIGSRIQTELQQPWIIVLFSALFIALALSLFGVYELQLPPRWQQRLTEMSRRQKGGTYLGVFLMGGISSLIVSPCVSAPLVGVLTYIAQTGNVLMGTVALLALGIGMGIPLLLLGASAGRLLPKAGSWMVLIERLMGVLMLAFAIWILSRILPGPVTLFLWGALCVFVALYLGALVGEKRRLQRSLGAIVFVYGVILMIGAFLGNTDVWHPWENWQWSTQNSAKGLALNFVTIKNMQQLNDQLQLAKKEGTPVILDFYADWCESCVKMEHHVFNAQDVRMVLSNFKLLRADITANNAFDQALLTRFNVIAPPTFLFFDSQGKELYFERIVGEQNAAEFIAHLLKIK